MALKILVTIANHGFGNRQYLDQLLSTYKNMPLEITLVVLSNIPKDLGPDVEVVVGTPSSNPWSLPFAHRKIFRERINEYDFFLYSEDDTLLSWSTMEAFIQSTQQLHHNEIAGFLRTEESNNGQIFYSSCHSFFHWIPSSVRERGGKLWAKYSNEHSACFIASQQQLKQAIASGGFDENPHEGRHDMLCSAATDIYIQCGLERLICIDKLNDFILRHLPNKYIGKMGLPENEMRWQIDALKQVYEKMLSPYEVLNPETKLPGCHGSKHYREKPDKIINNLLESESPKRILVWGSGDGVFEDSLKEFGHSISVYPLDAVVGQSCQKRGLSVLSPELMLSAIKNNLYDFIILRDILHLIENPQNLLADIKRFLFPSGGIIIRVPNFHDIGMIKHRLSDQRFRIPWTKDCIGALPLTPKELKQMVRSAGFNKLKLLNDVPKNRQSLNKISVGLFKNSLTPYFYLTAMK